MARKFNRFEMNQKYGRNWMPKDIEIKSGEKKVEPAAVPEASLFDVSEKPKQKEPIRFDGASYDPQTDNQRLTGQIKRIWDVVKNGGWFTLGAIAKLTGDPEASISAQLRHLRKSRFGAHQLNMRKCGNSGLHEYQLIVRGDSKKLLYKGEKI